MTSLLQPTYSLTLGSQAWTAQALSIEVRLEAAPLLDVLRVRLPASAPLAAAVGDPALLTLDSGEKSGDIFAGTVDSIRRGFDDITVTALDAGGALARFRPATTFEQVTAGTVVRNLCGEVGVDLGEIADGVALAFYVADPARTALEHVARVCAWSGALARVTVDGKLETLVINATQPDVAFKFGRELLGLCQGDTSAGVEAFVVAGESGAGAPSAPESLRPTTDFFAGNRPDGPGAKSRWRFEPALRTAQAAGTAGAAWQRLYTSSRKRGAMEAFLQPDLRVGTVFEIQELPEGLAQGPFWAASVCHRIAPEGCVTRVRFVQGGDSFDPLALLGSLAGAIGGL
jgi:hypothetical protein